MCLEFVVLLVRPDVVAPARLVKFFLQGLLHTSIFVRKVSRDGRDWGGAPDR